MPVPPWPRHVARCSSAPEERSGTEPGAAARPRMVQARPPTYRRYSHECPTGYPLDKPRRNPRVMTCIGSSELPARWRTTADTLERFAPAAAAAFRDCASELEAAGQDVLDAVTLQEAHQMGGYSVDHLQRLVRRGSIENVGRKGSPRIRRSDVPSRPGHALPCGAPTSQFGSRRRMALAVITSTSRGD